MTNDGAVVFSRNIVLSKRLELRAKVVKVNMSRKMTASLPSQKPPLCDLSLRVHE